VQLHLDHLLTDLRDRCEEILAAIDADELLVKRQSGDLILANASKALFTPQRQHQLYAKGIVYRRDPYRLVSLPLIKIYNLGERSVSIDDLAALNVRGVRVRFLRKLDGCLVQAFRADGRTWFTTRGMIEGAPVPRGQAGDDVTSNSEFDYLNTVRRLAARVYPALLEEPAVLEGRTLIFELIHPEARIITNYGAREDLVLLAAFDHRRHRYAPHEEVRTLGEAYRLATVDALSPPGATLAEQVESLLASLAGTDQEGSVLSFERGDEVVYRVKVKSADYLRLTRQMALCTYDRTVALLTANPHLQTWGDLEAFLKAAGKDEMPEELLPYYREHYERYAAYVEACEQLRTWAEGVARRLEAEVGGRSALEPRLFRKAFAARATGYPHSGLIFAALDGRLDRGRVCEYATTLQEARRALQEV
jgi:hypothetical protein